jgi:hypothetical protein
VGAEPTWRDGTYERHHRPRWCCRAARIAYTARQGIGGAWTGEASNIQQIALADGDQRLAAITLDELAGRLSQERRRTGQARPFVCNGAGNATAGSPRAQPD